MKRQHEEIPQALPAVVNTVAELANRVKPARAAGKLVGLVPTMGALHAGHLSLVDASRQQCGYTVVTIFVNPTQFAPGEDFQRYPRTLEADLQALATRGVDLVFAPDTAEMYPSEHATRVEVAGPALPLEGEFRPGHFSGVATVVLKLFNQAQADWAFFGQKDFQQAAIIKRMVADLDVPIRIRVCPIVRDFDGLALSSRNIYLDPAGRAQALQISRSLEAAQQLYAHGERSGAAIERRMREVLGKAPQLRVDYAAVVDAGTLGKTDSIERPAVALVAARVGNTRLIDNHLLDEPFPRVPAAGVRPESTQ